MKRLMFAYGLVFVAIILGSSGPTAFKEVMKEMDQLVVVASFLFVGSIAMFILAYVESVRRGQSIQKSIQDARTIISYWKWLLMGLAMAITYVCYVKALEFNSITETMLVYRVAPLFCIFFAAIILKEEIKRWWVLFLSFGTCFFGVIISKNISNVNYQAFLGMSMLYIFVAAVAYAFRVVMERYMQREGGIPKCIIAGIPMVIAFMFVLIYSLLNGKEFVITKWKDFFLIAWLGIGTVGLPIFLNLCAYERIGNYTRLAFFQYLIPPVGATYAWYFHGEHEIESLTFWMGLLLISVGVFIVDRWCADKRKTVLFVCKGNIHRSVIAEISLRQELENLGLSKKYKVISRGIQGCCGTARPKHDNLTRYETEWSFTKPILERLGVDLSEIANHIAKSVTKEDVQRATVVYAMELAVLGKPESELPNSLFAQFPRYSLKMHFFGDIEENAQEIADCAGTESQEVHDVVNKRIVYGIRNNLQKILNHVNNGGKR